MLVDLQWHSGLKRSGYDVRMLGVYKLLDGSLSTGLLISSDDVAYLQDRRVGSHIVRRQTAVIKVYIYISACHRSSSIGQP